MFLSVDISFKWDVFRWIFWLVTVISLEISVSWGLICFNLLCLWLLCLVTFLAQENPVFLDVYLLRDVWLRKRRTRRRERDEKEKERDFQNHSVDQNATKVLLGGRKRNRHTVTLQLRFNINDFSTPSNIFNSPAPFSHLNNPKLINYCWNRGQAICL